MIDSGAFTNGSQVAEFERAFASFADTSQCVGLASGLDALRLALLACGIEPGDEVIVPADTFIATFEAVSQAGGTPVPVGGRRNRLQPRSRAVAAAIGPRTRFLMPVHLYGQFADMQRLLAVADRHDLVVIEDACQAHGATATAFAPVAPGARRAFSFYPGKNLGAFGDAGALTTDDEQLAANVRSLREHGQRESTSTSRRGSRRGWTRSRRSRSPTASLPRGLERRAARRGGVLRRRADGRRRPRAAARRPKPACVAPLSDSHRRPRRPRRVSAGTRDRHGPSLPGAAPSLRGLSASRLRGRQLPALRGDRVERFSRCRCFPA